MKEQIQIVAWSTAQGLIQIAAELKADLQKLPDKPASTPAQQELFIEQYLLTTLSSKDREIPSQRSPLIGSR